MEKKIEVQVGERKVRIMPHMLSDATKFGATTTQTRVIKEVPKELKQPIRVEPLPKMGVAPEEIKAPVLTKEPVLPKTSEATEKKSRKAPVRSKSKK